MKDWLIVFLIYADFREETGIIINEKMAIELNSLFSDLVEINLNEHSKIYVIINRVRYLIGKGNAMSPKSNDKTFLFEVQKRAGKKNKIKSLTRLDGTRLPHDETTLSVIFQQITTKNPSRKTLLVTWGHGSGFGIFKIKEAPDRMQLFKPLDQFKGNFNIIDDSLQDIFDVNNLLKEQEKPDVFKSEIFDQPIYSFDNIRFSFKNTSTKFHEIINKLIGSEETRKYFEIDLYRSNNFLKVNKGEAKTAIETFNNILDNDERKILFGNMYRSRSQRILFEIKPEDGIGEMLTNEELSVAIERGFCKKKIDVLLMMNCLMMNIPACYALRKQVAYLIAPQGSIDLPGYNYKAILNRLMQGESIPDTADSSEEIKELASTCVSSTFDFTDPEREKHQKTIEAWAVFCFNLNLFEELANKIDETALYLLDNFTDLKHQIEESRPKCYRFDDYKYFKYYLIDIIHFLTIMLKKLEGSNKDITFKNNIKQFKDELLDIRNRMKINEMKINNCIYYVYEEELGAKPIKDIDASGLSIYFPKTLDKSSPLYKRFLDKRTSTPSLFYKEKDNWIKLMEKIRIED